MRHMLLGLVLATMTVVAPAARDGGAEAALIGTWSGTYDGAGVGKYAMAITRDAAKALAGTLEVSPSEGGGYSATFKSIVVNGQSAVLKYDTPDGGAEIQIDVTLDGTSLKGTWRAIEAGGTSVVAEGTLTATRN
jgi:hypothetical protein